MTLDQVLKSDWKINPDFLSAEEKKKLFILSQELERSDLPKQMPHLADRFLSLPCERRTEIVADFCDPPAGFEDVYRIALVERAIEKEYPFHKPLTTPPLNSNIYKREID